MFKVPGEEYDRTRGQIESEIDERSVSAPLLPGGEGRGSREGRMEELEELERAEGPQEGTKGTLMDGIANVSSPCPELGTS